MMVTNTLALDQGESLLIMKAVDAFNEKHSGPEWKPARKQLQAVLARMLASTVVESRPARRRSRKPTD